MTKIRSYISLIAVLLISLVALAVSPDVSADTSVFINEIHYDNAGTDTGEAIEVAGPAGTDLTGWTIVLYNGSGGASYNTSNLSGVIPDQQNGFGTVFISYPSNGIQNGAPDGVALVDNGNNVIQFLSYEGSFTAVGGPADGMVSTDIGVLQAGSGAVGNSLQLGGAGTVYEDFSWQGEGENLAATFGAINTNQSFGDVEPGAPELVINEVDYDQPSTDTAEFVELKNVGSSPANLLGVTLELVNGASGGAAISGSFDLPDVSLAAGAYYVICGDAANVANCDLDVSTDTNLIQNGAPDAVGLRFEGELIDAVSYEGDTAAPYTEGSGAGLEDTGDGGLSRCPDGVDTDQNNVDFVVAAITPGAQNDCVVPGAADLVINEIDYDQPSTDTAEFVEIRNNDDSAVDLSGYSLEMVNGSGGTTYRTITLPAVTLAPDDYFVVCGNAANVANCDLDASPDTDLIQNGAPDAVALLFDGAIVDTVSYEGDTIAPYTEGSGAGLVDEASEGMSISRCEDGVDTNQNNVDFVFTESTPGEANACDDGGGGDVEIGMCYDPVTHFIHEVQGSGDASPLAGQTVVVEGVVVGDFQNNGLPDNGDLNGFHLQEEDGDADADAATSEGVFVYTPGTPVDVSNGDVVRVLGAVSEFNGLTEITIADALVCASGAAVTPTVVTLPVDEVSDLEAFEGMSVTFTQELYISEYFNFDRFGEIVLTTERQFQPTAVYEPGSPEAAALADLNSRSRITLDDGRTPQNPDPALHPDGGIFDMDNLFRGGDILLGVTGVMDYSFGLYRIQPTEGAEHIEANPRTATPEDVGGDIQVASFNVLNYFTTLTSAGEVCGPPGNLQDCRGADTPEELARQRAKIVAAIAAMDAEVVGLIEIQNDEGAATEDLVSGLNDELGAGSYDYIDTGYIGTDAIKQAFIYQPAEVTPVGDYAVLDTPEFVDPLNSGTPKSRPALAQTFMDNSSGGVFTVVVNHLKSKGSECAGDFDPEQGNCNLTRELAAQALADWLATDPTGSGDADFLIIGDLNAYDKEDPIDALTERGYTDLVRLFEGEYAYSYVFDGQLGYLDHALANDNLLPQVTGTTVWHINADEPDLIDYDMSFKQDAQDALWAPDPYRSSDHDPVIVGLALNGSPVCDGAVPSIASIWPPDHRFVSIDILGVTDPEGDALTVTVDGIFQDEAVDAEESGNTAPDGMGVGTATAQVRAERVGDGGNGRVYHIFFTATDTAGGSCSGEVLVSVPVARNMAAIDDGPLYDSTVEP